MSDNNRKKLSDLNLPNDLKTLSISECTALCKEIRQLLISTVSKNGGHLASNLGVVELANGNYDRAKENFARAKNVGCDEAGYNMGVINIRDGEYEKAIANFGSTPSFNKALAQVLAKNVDDAKRTLNSINSQDAIVDYLKAIIGSRQNEETHAMDNLKKAVDKDPNLKNWAKYDVEFIRYFESDTFRNIVD